MSQKSIFTTYKEDFIKVTKRILVRELSNNPKTLQSHEDDLFSTYNEIVKIAARSYTLVKEQQQLEIQQQLFEVRDKFKICADKLGLILEYNNNILEELNKNQILHRTKYNEKYELIVGENNGQILEENLYKNLQLQVEHNISILEKSITGDQSFSDALENFGAETDTEPNTTMAMSSVDFVKLVSSQINKSYGGDPLGLKSFIKNIELIETIITAENNVATLRALLPTIILTKLEGKALECIPTENITTASIKEALEANIKPDNSNVVSGRMLALKLKPKQLAEASKQAEELAEALERTLVIEGTTQAKARQMATEKTIEMCRSNARSDLLKSVLASSTFTTPKDVIAKYVTESSKEYQEKQVLAIYSRKNGNNNNKRGRGGKKFFNNNQYNNDNQNNNGGRNYNNGRGKSRGGNRGGYNSGRGYYNNNSNYNNSNYNNNNNNIRMLENSQAPQNAYLGAPQRQYPQITEQ